jgi:hypothetical protein
MLTFAGISSGAEAVDLLGPVTQGMLTKEFSARLSPHLRRGSRLSPTSATLLLRNVEEPIN